MIRPRPAPRPRAALLALLLVAGVAGSAACSDGGSPRPGPTITEDNGVAALGDAIKGLNTARAAVLSDTNAITSGANALDAGDARAAEGDRAGMGELRTRIDSGHHLAVTGIRRAPQRLATYDQALNALFAAAKAEALNATQRAAVEDVVTKGRAEHKAMTDFARVATGIWPSYGKLYEAGSTWYTRARGGWYRSTKESADAYAVMVSADRPALDRARSLLQTSDAARVRAVSRMSAAITAARTALVDLVAVDG